GDSGGNIQGLDAVCERKQGAANETVVRAQLPQRVPPNATHRVAKRRVGEAEQKLLNMGALLFGREFPAGNEAGTSLIHRTTDGGFNPGIADCLMDVGEPRLVTQIGGDRVAQVVSV